MWIVEDSPGRLLGAKASTLLGAGLLLYAELAERSLAFVAIL